MYTCEICGAELRTRQGYRGHQRFRHDTNGGGRRGGRIFAARQGQVVQVAADEEGSTIGEAMNLACSQQILEVLLRIEALLVERDL